MAVRRYAFFIGTTANTPNNNPASYFDCDTAAELPSANQGGTIGCLAYARDTDLMYFNGSSGWSPIDTQGQGGGTLNQAYNYGGAGAGRVITADGGPVTITSNSTQLQLVNTTSGHTADFTLDTDGYLTVGLGDGLGMEVNGASTADLFFTLYNSSATAAAHAVISAATAQNGGDPFLGVAITDVETYSIGMNQSDGDETLLIARGYGFDNNQNWWGFTTDGRFFVRDYVGGGYSPVAGNAMDVSRNVNGTILSGVYNASSGSSALAGFFCKADGSVPRGVALAHTSSTYSDGSDVQANEALLNAENNTAGLRIRTTNSGNGYIVFVTRTGGGTLNEVALMTAAGNVAIGLDTMLTTATDGFIFVPTCAGAPTGVPTGMAGYAPAIVDTTNHRWYFYSGGSWRNAGP